MLALGELRAAYEGDGFSVGFAVLLVAVVIVDGFLDDGKEEEEHVGGDLDEWLFGAEREVVDHGEEHEVEVV